MQRRLQRPSRERVAIYRLSRFESLLAAARLAPVPEQQTPRPPTPAPSAEEVAGGRVIDLSGPDVKPPAELTVDDANDLRGFHFKRLMRRPLTWILTALVAIPAAIAGAIALGPLLGLAILAGVLLIAVVVVLAVADSKAEAAFFTAYSEQRGMTLTGATDLPARTPLLRKGDERKAEHVMEGPLADGLAGTVALYTYTDVYHDKNGRHESSYRFTVVICELPGTREHCSELLCNRKFGFKAFENLEDAFRSKERVRLESVKLDERFEIFADEKQDQNWLRQLFSPSFILWMAEEAPEKFAFELVDGTLCCNVKGHKSSAQELDRMREAAARVAGRLREESSES